MAPCLHYNKNMKNIRTKKAKLYIILIITLLITGFVTACTERQAGKAATADKKIRVAVVDTGFSDKSIPDGSIAGGKNYIVESMGTDDTYVHGTAVASIILENVPDAELVALVSSVYDHGKLTQVDADTFARIIMDAVDVYECDVINVSAGFAADVETVRQAVDYAKEKGVVIVAAAGNDYQDNPDAKYYPAAYESVIAVGSMNENKTSISDFSQRGEWVDIYECGENITVKTLSGNERIVSGTSYSAAIVTARVCKILEENSNAGVDEVMKAIERLLSLVVNVQ